MIRKKAPHRGAFPMDPMEVKKWHSWLPLRRDKMIWFYISHSIWCYIYNFLFGKAEAYKIKPEEEMNI